MGQTQSIDLSDDGVDDVQIRRRERDEMRTTRRKKPEAKKRLDASPFPLAFRDRSPRSRVFLLEQSLVERRAFVSVGRERIPAKRRQVLPFPPQLSFFSLHFSRFVCAAASPVRLSRRLCMRSNAFLSSLAQFMKHTEAPNHIRAIREAGREREKDDGGIEGTFEIADLVRKKKPKEDSEEFKVDGPLMDLPKYEQSESESSSSDDEDRGQYHFEISTLQKDAPLAVTDPEAHPVIIDGECAVGKELKLRDCSPLARDFPIFRVEWYLGTDIGDAEKFSVQYASEGSLSLPFSVPDDSVGKYIQAKAYRNVEDQLHETQLASAKAGVYDPHIGGPRHTDYLPPPGVVRVCSTAVSGPCLISDASAYVLLKCLSRGAFTCAVKLRDVWKRDSYGEAFVSLEGSRALAKSGKKLPATLFVDNAGLLQLRYRLADVVKLTGGDGSDLGVLGLDLFGGLLGGRTPEGQAGLWGDAEVDDASAAPAKVEDLEKFSTNLDAVSFRPSEAPNTIVAALEWQPTDGSKAGKQDFFRFDVDPAVGRDNALYVLIGFQAAQAKRKFNQREWETYVQRGNLQVAKDLVQRYLEAITRKTEETRPAFERMATTPWSILNAPQRLT